MNHIFSSPTPLGRVLRGTALPEDTILAKNQLHSGIARLSASPIGAYEVGSLLRVSRGSALAEDVVGARSAFNNILKPLR